MKPEIPQLLDELRQICTQYAKEVPKKRRPWPESVRTRVFRLRFLGVSNSRIAQELGIPVMTLYTWRTPEHECARALPSPKPGAGEGGFLPIRIVHRKSGLAPFADPGQVPKSKRCRPTTVTVKNNVLTSTLTVVLPSGLRLEGLTLEQAVEVTRNLSR